MTKVDFPRLNCWRAFFMRKTCSAVFSCIHLLGVRVLEVVIGSELLFLCGCGARFFPGWWSGGDFNGYGLSGGGFGDNGGFFFGLRFGFEGGVFNNGFGEAIRFGVGSCGCRRFFTILASSRSTKIADIACTYTSTL